MPRVEETGVSVVGGGGRGRTQRGPWVPSLQHLGDGGPLGPKLGAGWALDSGPLEGAVRTLVVGVPPPVPRPSKEALEAREPGAQPLEGGKDKGGVGPPSPLMGDGEHCFDLAVPPPQQLAAGARGVGGGGP